MVRGIHESSTGVVWLTLKIPAEKTKPERTANGVMQDTGPQLVGTWLNFGFLDKSFYNFNFALPKCRVLTI